MPDSASAVETVSPDCRVVAPFTGKDLSDEVYRQIAEVLRQQQNFDLDGYKRVCLKRRLAIRIRTVGGNDPAAYIELLRGSEEEQQQLLTTVSIHVSEFFRNRSLYTVMDEKILPELFARTDHSRQQMKIWSVGCANGEEPYSVALLCHTRHYDHDRVSIVATDLSGIALARAKRGVFAVGRLRNVPADLRDQYFTGVGKNYRLSSAICRRVQFFRHDILGDPPLCRADLILCRNLLIYFSRSQQQKTLERLAAALVPGGYLILGRAETLVAACRDLFVCIDPAERIYRRLET